MSSVISRKSAARHLICFALSVVSSYFLSTYLELSPIALFAAAFSVLSSVGAVYLLIREQKHRDTGFLILSFILSAVIVLGRHLHIEVPYAGLMGQNYIIPYGYRDILAFLLMPFCLFIFIRWLDILLLRLRPKLLTGENDRSSVRDFFAVSLLLILVRLPYLFSYWPGFFFNDTENSVMQAVGAIPMSNRNPLLYTLFIKLCITIGNGFRTGDLTAACAVYSIIQICYVSGCLSYVINTASRGMKKIWKYTLILIFSLSPYIGAFSIAMWKDPVFCASAAAYSALLFSLVKEGPEKMKCRHWLAFVFLTVMLLFWRNNGFCAVAGMLAALAALIISGRKEKDRRKLFMKMTAVTTALLLAWAVVLVPVYKALGVGTPKEEAAGLMLNQMARVAACGGEMSAEEADYMNEMLPLELYPELYRPCCVDLLKWDSHFNYDPLYSMDFYRNWISMGMKNPGLYFEAWQLETFGFWTINSSIINLNDSNISYGGLPHNFRSEEYLIAGKYNIDYSGLFGFERWRDVLPIDTWSVPLGLILWFMVFSCISLSRRGKKTVLLCFAPQFGINLGLILGSPMYYLPRYGASSQFLLPLFLYILLWEKGEHTGKNHFDEPPAS